MYQVMIAGAGKIGSLIACLLADSKAYQIHLADLAFTGADAQRLLKIMPEITTVALDVMDEESTTAYLKKNKIRAVVSSLPFFLNKPLAVAATKAQSHYFDLTEDTTVASQIKTLAKDAGSLLVPQCGLAPGFIGIAAHSLMEEFEVCHHVRLRVGALPERANNALHYSLTWSTDGLINEYGNPCYGIEAGKPVVLKPLEGLESIQIDGCEYEAFNTSGGLGSLGDMYQGKVDTLNYKTIRYPGHCEKMRFLMNALQLNQDRPTLKRILERALPKTYQDLVIVYVTVEGIKDGELCEKSFLKKLYPVTIHGLSWSAIQASTASGVCAVLDLVLKDKTRKQGFFLQETLPLASVLNNRFGHYFSV